MIFSQYSWKCFRVIGARISEFSLVIIKIITLQSCLCLLIWTAWESSHFLCLYEARLKCKCRMFMTYFETSRERDFQLLSDNYSWTFVSLRGETDSALCDTVMSHHHGNHTTQYWVQHLYQYQAPGAFLCWSTVNKHHQACHRQSIEWPRVRCNDTTMTVDCSRRGPRKLQPESRSSNTTTTPTEPVQTSDWDSFADYKDSPETP